MSIQRGVLSLVAMCLFFLLLSFVGLGADFITRLFTNIDGLLLIAVCLLTVGLSLLMLFSIFKDEGWLPGAHKKGAAGGDAKASGAGK